MKQNTIIVILIAMTIMLSCKKAAIAPEADPTTFMVNKWWCDLNKKTASQYFKSDATWAQGAEGGRFNDTGKWALSADRKKIVVSDVKDSSSRIKTGWEYDIRSASETKLFLNFGTLNIVMDMEVCK